MIQNPGRQPRRIVLINPNSSVTATATMVVIGGGPLGEAARELRPMFTVPVIVPIPSAVARIIRLVAACASG